MLRRDTANFLYGGELCVSTYANLKWTKAKRFSEFSVGVPIVLKSAGHKWYLLPNRAIRCQPSQSLFITLNIMYEPLSKNSTRPALTLWSQSLVRVVQRSLPKMTGLLSQKPQNVRRTFWIVRSNAGLWKNCESIFSRKKSFLPSALKLFAPFCTKQKSGSGEPRPGKNATTRSLSLKKTDSQVCKPACIQRPDNIFRRVRSPGDTSSSGTSLLPHRPSEKTSCNIYPPSRCSALAGVLRCASEKTVGLCSSSQKASGVFGNVEVFEEEVSGQPADTFDSGQLLTAPQAEGAEVLPTEQHSYDMDTDQCFMAESYRMPVYSCEGICDSRNRLSKP